MRWICSAFRDVLFCGIEAGMDLAVVHVVQWAHKIIYQ